MKNYLFTNPFCSSLLCLVINMIHPKGSKISCHVFLSEVSKSHIIKIAVLKENFPLPKEMLFVVQNDQIPNLINCYNERENRFHQAFTKANS